MRAHNTLKNRSKLTLSNPLNAENPSPATAAAVDPAQLWFVKTRLNARLSTNELDPEESVSELYDTALSCVKSGSEPLDAVCPPELWLTSMVAVVAEVTVWVNGADVLELKFVSPMYLAVIGWLPTERLDVVNVAIPPLPSGEVPNVTLPSRKVTVPVGVPDPTGVTVAVNVTAWPDLDGFSEEAIVVVVFFLLLVTVCTVLPLLVRKLPFPL